MGIQAVKLNLVKKILSLEQESIIKKIDKILENEMIVGYTVDGKPLTQKAYNARIDLAEKQLKSGQTISQNDLEKESESW
jgi:hypothetical protein